MKTLVRDNDKDRWLNFEEYKHQQKFMDLLSKGYTGKEAKELLDGN